MTKSRIVIILFILFDLLLFGYLLLHGKNIALLNSQGVIAEKQRSILIFEISLAFIIAACVFAITIFITHKYRAGNFSDKNTSDWSPGILIKIMWWAFPTVVI